MSPQCPPEYRPKNQAELTALQRETDFAFKQSFAFCPYSPEAVFRYVNFLLQSSPPRFDDALLVAQTCQKLDPYNGQITGLIKKSSGLQKQVCQPRPDRGAIAADGGRSAPEPDEHSKLLNLAGFYLQMQQTNRAVELFDHALAAKTVSASAVGAIAQMYAAMRNYAQLETALEKMTGSRPTSPNRAMTSPRSKPFWANPPNRFKPCASRST